ncbi:HlyD family efflux transporter periplasmic adaptor subunit [Ramlibacter montanisoli]|uniref:HlyD family efflux transporter periplasmic adaptor subunit n=1 Tax=Ramlibacter montanisoli TaxID=2732512 RepID=A0A849K5R5_9BURK|nr:HlyD family efflux transporter periplasmic adaptor subunit [Ramlibacter montanisoli]NNU43762.1 HlyD family efflux transporter periplasmic adaptor subunit [Ramlibacter montanisoli]
MTSAPPSPTHGRSVFPGSEFTTPDPWDALASAADGEQLCRAWLEVLATSLLQARAGIVLLAQDDGSFAPVAGVPATRDLSYLSEIATDALRTREGVVRHDELGHVRLAYPLQLQQVLAGVVVLDLGAAEPAALERALQLTHWGAGWLVDLLRQRGAAQASAGLRQGRFLLDTVLALQNERTEREGALALVNRLAREFGCRQVLLGVARRKTLRLVAVSGSAVFDHRAGAMHSALEAMHEAYDQRQRIDWPPPAEAPALRIHATHARYAAQQGVAALCSVPLVAAQRVLGVLMLERDHAFTPADREFVDTLALGVAPLLDLQHDAGLGAWHRAGRTARRWIGVATDSSHPALKLGAASLALVLLLLGTVPAPMRVPARAQVEGSMQRSAVVPFEGFLRAAPARAGDTVKAGQVLAVLEDKDLKLERVRWQSELEVAQRKELEAMAKGNRVDQRLAAAQANQARAQLDLVLGKLERVEVTAPFDATVVAGDLSQQLGSPLEQGKVLFELAPLDSWRVILKVDERDIGHVRTGATGELVLASLPGRSWPFTVRKLTPVSVAEEGHTYFRVEAELADKAPKLSPNMEGVGKIDAGRASLLWIWSRPLVDWARLAWWKLVP